MVPVWKYGWILLCACLLCGCQSSRVTINIHYPDRPDIPEIGITVEPLFR